ncbi:hypothetical protein JMJ56_08290 [Belnapia sp. T18]|uniref:Uncharacterized protein n=1 Tax=Belnapia arida TaxID=2804533 RepID=A0ABS1TZZ8_9PROT|nr:hypothetical protein [Belnapia arida]MBL6078001.1 hypothetical protein [Belnapia arida]
MPDRQDGRLTEAGPVAEAAIVEHPAGLRSHDDLMAENGGLVPWCGPATLALASGLPYRAASTLLRGIAPDWYPGTGPVVTAYWRDILGALEQLGVAHAPVALPERRPSLLGLVRGGLAPGWHLLRVTDHFLLLNNLGFGLAAVHDNRLTAAVLTAKTHGRRRVTHAAHLAAGPRLRF